MNDTRSNEIVAGFSLHLGLAFAGYERKRAYATGMISFSQTFSRS
jgi:hypothetical protein